MKKTTKILSLFTAILMLIAASITVNKAIFGHEIDPVVEKEIPGTADTDNITQFPDGSVVINTSSIPNSINGYAGPVPVDITVKDGIITSVEVLPNSESPSFLNRASSVLSEWIGKTPQEALTMKVDAISGATYSSLAIINNVNVGLAYYQGTGKNTGSSVPWKIWIALAVTLAACIFPLFVNNKIYYNVQLVTNIIVLGFWCGQFLDYALMIKYLSGGFVLPVGLVAISMLVAAFIYPIFGHPQHYCTYICPLGSMQQLVGKICGYKIHLSVKLLKGLDWFRKILWAVLMLLLWTDSLTGWMDLELFQAFQFQSASWGIITAASLFVVLSAVISRPYCRFICPTGSLFKRAENIG